MRKERFCRNRPRRLDGATMLSGSAVRARPWRHAMTKRSPFRYFKTSPEIIRLVVMKYVRFPPSPGIEEDLLHE